jgi:hypothetical protein
MFSIGFAVNVNYEKKSKNPLDKYIEIKKYEVNH